MYLGAEGVTNDFFKLQIHVGSWDHCFPKLFDIFKGLPSKHLADRHDAPDQGTARLPSSGYSSCQRCGRLKGSRIFKI